MIQVLNKKIFLGNLFDSDSPITGKETPDDATRRQNLHTRNGLLSGLICFNSTREEGEIGVNDQNKFRIKAPKISCFSSETKKRAHRISRELGARANEKAKWEAQQRKALQILLHSQSQSFIPGGVAENCKSADDFSEKLGVPTKNLDDNIRSQVKLFFENSKGSRYYSDFVGLIDCLYNLFLLQKRENQPAWISKLGSFESFVDHFCPQANKGEQARLISHIEYFIGTRLPRRLKEKPYDPRDGVETGPVYDGTGNWVELPKAWVDRRIVDEAVRLLDDGFPDREELFVHGTGSAAIGDIGKNRAIQSAASVMRAGGKVVTGEYATFIARDGHTQMTASKEGLGDVYTSEEGLGSDSYTLQRWFDETQVTFGISKAKQRAYNEANGIIKPYDNVGNEGVRVGPVVPLENVVAVSAPKAGEGKIRSWIELHCPHAKFASYEAINLLESKNLYGMLAERPKYW
ncbi:hypothetical protein ACQUJZ_22540 [Ralstonia pseudosolanacearum]|uniref:hypothetical protein n=1 Tax=Ralstonia pseudosolanacearum TaxID=1310165 RepID=UPI000FD8F7BF|nr:hypothetical protein [Ralstonia pseudosolanacearum]MCK4136291.1 hypothetical protein [Ralstonia pseudosolanacearum]QVX39800.1 hypothetical protein J4H89_06335 [Ralstonia solanacearum]UQY82769.1 hypothetical protein JNO62_00990 [Ralstonia pseudosolanacearum]